MSPYHIIIIIYKTNSGFNIFFIIIVGEPMYITLHLMQNINITTDESIHDLVKILADGSLIVYDLHRFRLYVPEQPLRIIQPRNLGKN